MQDDGNWGEPVNLGYPLNTTDDDFTISPLGVQEEDAVFLFAAGDEGQHPLFKFEIIDRDAVAVALPFDDKEVAELEEIEEDLAELEEEIDGSGGRNCRSRRSSRTRRKVRDQTCFLWLR